MNGENARSAEEEEEGELISEFDNSVFRRVNIALDSEAWDVGLSKSDDISSCRSDEYPEYQLQR